jgi:DNA-directed RNA polymerase II subunit RPB1
LEQNIMDNILLKGVKGINKVSMREESLNKYNPVTKVYEKQNEWIIEADGTNLIEILGHPSVDSFRTVSNDIHEIYNTLGIEAARQALYNEIMDVLAQTTVNYRHIALLVETMTNKGALMSIDRHGINQGDIGPLAKCSFEETTDRLIKAGMFTEHDNINGVSANIMLGQIAPCGTGDSQLIIDESLLPKKPTIESMLPSKLTRIAESTDEHSPMCDFDCLKFDMNIDTLVLDDNTKTKRDALDVFIKTES